jgi:hypothetical protein
MRGSDPANEFTSKKKLCIKNKKKFFITDKNFFNIVEGNFISQYLLTHLLQYPLVIQGIFVSENLTIIRFSFAPGIHYFWCA